MLTFEQARQEVISQISKLNHATSTVNLSVWDPAVYILAHDQIADRNYPPFDRATRDGYAARASESTPGATLRCIGEIKAGDALTQSLEQGTCVQIMTGAPVPPEADAVVMIEYTSRDKAFIHFEQSAAKGQNIVPAGSETAKDQPLLSVGTRLGYAELDSPPRSAPRNSAAQKNLAWPSCPPEMR